MYFLHKYEYGTFKPVEISVSRGPKVERRIMEGMNQFMLLYREREREIIITIISKQKCLLKK
jgi:hypothetical protein